MDALGPDTVRRIARLARLALTDEECERHGRELTKILAAFEALARADAPGAAPARTPVAAAAAAAPCAAAEQEARGEACSRTRADEVLATLPQERLLAAAPDREGPYVRVPAILGGVP